MIVRVVHVWCVHDKHSNEITSHVFSHG